MNERELMNEQELENVARPLAGRAAIVTGSSRGIGRAVADALATAGASVVVNGRDQDTSDIAADQIRSTGAQARSVAGSAADPDVAHALVDEALDQFGRLDILINCAGIAEPPGSSILDVTSEAWHQLIGSHLHSTFETCRVAAPVMAAQGHGAIVNTSSHAFLGTYGGTGYPAGKGGVTSLTLAIAAELRERGVRANVVCPGARTRLSTGDEYEAHIEELFERGILDDALRFGSLNPGPPEHVAPLYVYLASDLASAITGQIFVGSGGYIGWFPAYQPDMVTWRDHDTNPPWTVDQIAELLG